jgi:hypothetical protein
MCVSYDVIKFKENDIKSEPGLPTTPSSARPAASGP